MRYDKLLAFGNANDNSIAREILTGNHIINQLEIELGAAQSRMRTLQDLLGDVLCSGVVEQPPSVNYLDVQIDKTTWAAIKEAIK